MKEKTTTLPTVSTARNGSGTAATRRDHFDIFGNLTWTMDERGFLTRNTYDVPTGALTQRIEDVDTAQIDDEPAGWETPTGGGLHLVTDFEHDDLGRPTQQLGPAHTVDLDGTATTVRRATWIVYHDGAATDEVRTAQGYATGLGRRLHLHARQPRLHRQARQKRQPARTNQGHPRLHLG